MTHLILFDSECGMCSTSVRFIIRHDPASQFKFAPLQSAAAQAILKANELSTTELDTFVYVRSGKVYVKSTAALQVCNTLGGLWRCAALFYIVPEMIRDRIYDAVARNRYRFFRQSCRISPDDMQGYAGRFIE
jgi:predicted DCC family thiol-disulfide oxidoreductase YuxK